MSGQTKCNENQMIASETGERTKWIKREKIKGKLKDEERKKFKKRIYVGIPAILVHGENATQRALAQTEIEQFSLAVNTKTVETLATAYNSNS